MRVVFVPQRFDRFVGGYIVLICLVGIWLAIHLARHERAVAHCSLPVAAGGCVAFLVIAAWAIWSWRTVGRAFRHLVRDEGEPDPLAAELRRLPGYFPSDSAVVRATHRLEVSEALLVIIGVFHEPPRAQPDQPLLQPFEFTPFRFFWSPAALAAALWLAWYAIPHIGTPNAEMLRYRQCLLYLAAAGTVALLGYRLYQWRTTVQVLHAGVTVRRYSLLNPNPRRVHRYSMASDGTIAILWAGTLPDDDRHRLLIRGERPRIFLQYGSQSDSFPLRRPYVSEVLARLLAGSCPTGATWDCITRDGG